MPKYRYRVRVEGTKTLSPITKELVITQRTTSIGIECDGIVIVSFWDDGEVRFYPDEIKTVGFTPQIA